jgi:hypothetical protein
MQKAGDVLLVQSGHIGHSAVVTNDHEGHNCHAIIVITPIKETLTGSFLSLYFNSSMMRRKFEEIRSGIHSSAPDLRSRQRAFYSTARFDYATATGRPIERAGIRSASSPSTSANSPRSKN